MNKLLPALSCGHCVPALLFLSATVVTLSGCGTVNYQLAREQSETKPEGVIPLSFNSQKPPEYIIGRALKAYGIDLGNSTDVSDIYRNLQSPCIPVETQAISTSKTIPEFDPPTSTVVTLTKEIDGVPNSLPDKSTQKTTTSTVITTPAAPAVTLQKVINTSVPWKNPHGSVQFSDANGASCVAITQVSLPNANGPGNAGGSGSTAYVPLPVAAIIHASVDECIFHTYDYNSDFLALTSWSSVLSEAFLGAGVVEAVRGGSKATVYGATSVTASLAGGVAKFSPNTTPISTANSVIQSGLGYYPLLTAEATARSTPSDEEKKAVIVSQLSRLWDAAGSGCPGGILRGRLNFFGEHLPRSSD